MSLEWKLRQLSNEVDMLTHALYLNRNEPLFRMVRDGREHAIFGKQPWKK